ncbi:hypothetical protein ACFXTO_014108 [Malus domestica]
MNLDASSSSIAYSESMTSNSLPPLPLLDFGYIFFSACDHVCQCTRVKWVHFCRWHLLTGHLISKVDIGADAATTLSYL